MSLGAGCLCGAVRMEITADPLAVRTCWCGLCQYLGGGSATVNACFPADSVPIDGEVRYHDSVADSGSTVRRGFCAICGTPLTSAAPARPHLLFIRAGALDDPSVAAPQMTIWTAMAPDWAYIGDAIPALPGQPPPVA